jgi:hypothetical protein
MNIDATDGRTDSVRRVPVGQATARLSTGQRHTDQRHDR